MDAWLRRGPRAWLLWPVSLAYGAAVALRRALYRHGMARTERIGVPVVVVGNVVAGGAGKTPTVIALVEHLRRQGWSPGVVSRGYGRRQGAGGDILEVQADTPAEDAGDEPSVIARRCGVPVFVGRRRVQAARALRAAYPGVNIVVADDGLQHLALARDVEVCVFDERGVGNGMLLPAGPLREAWPRAVDLVLHTGDTAAFGDGFRARRALADHAVNQGGRTIALADLRSGPVEAVAGIARPGRFFDMLRQAGFDLAAEHPLADHADFHGWTPTHAQLPLVCTEKDAVKLWRTRPDAWAIPLTLEVDPAFFAALDARLAPRPTPASPPL